jgi:uncharacterized membrane protein
MDLTNGGSKLTSFKLSYLAIPFILILVDLPWLLLGSKNSKSMIKDIQGSDMTVKWLPSIVVYVALSYLILLPTTSLEAFLLGTATYAVYDFTNLATLDKYKTWFAITDSLWGGVLFLIVFNVLKWLKIN